MRLHTFGMTDIGMKRKINQDSFLRDDAMSLYLVADGMGGHRGGEVASQLAVQVIQEFCQKEKNLPPREKIDQAINASCEQIFQQSSENAELAGMGTTILALLFQDGHAYIGQVGDSRAYLMNGGQIWQVTEDHSLVNEEIRAGRLAANEAHTYQFKNVITRSVGYERKVTVDIYRRKVAVGDTFLLCSDGLSGLVQTPEIEEAIRTLGLEQGLKALVQMANDRGGDDNITALVCRVESV